ncbi:hypothetical protein NM208_g7166 [Fusarium decemcellulare]|uniref:Uncharacterized protein n=1 Tax=Fusarium decemcellulare TaxID=57161 RepID=A0ACC1SA83_9HYPO|nr:hypothetical protein NM208_g7166 [Fusarium decemcellulare]
MVTTRDLLEIVHLALVFAVSCRNVRYLGIILRIPYLNITRSLACCRCSPLQFAIENGLIEPLALILQCHLEVIRCAAGRDNDGSMSKLTGEALAPFSASAEGESAELDALITKHAILCSILEAATESDDNVKTTFFRSLLGYAAEFKNKTHSKVVLHLYYGMMYAINGILAHAAIQDPEHFHYWLAIMFPSLEARSPRLRKVRADTSLFTTLHQAITLQHHAAVNTALSAVALATDLQGSFRDTLQSLLIKALRIALRQTRSDSPVRSCQIELAVAGYEESLLEVIIQHLLLYIQTLSNESEEHEARFFSRTIVAIFCRDLSDCLEYDGNALKRIMNDGILQFLTEGSSLPSFCLNHSLEAIFEISKILIRQIPSAVQSNKGAARSALEQLPSLQSCLLNFRVQCQGASQLVLSLCLSFSSSLRVAVSLEGIDQEGIQLVFRAHDQIFRTLWSISKESALEVFDKVLVACLARDLQLNEKSRRLSMSCLVGFVMGFGKLDKQSDYQLFSYLALPVRLPELDTCSTRHVVDELQSIRQRRLNQLLHVVAGIERLYDRGAIEGFKEGKVGFTGLLAKRNFEPYEKMAQARDGDVTLPRYADQSIIDEFWKDKQSFESDASAQYNFYLNDFKPRCC